MGKVVGLLYRSSKLFIRLVAMYMLVSRRSYYEWFSSFRNASKSIQSHFIIDN